MDCVAKAAKIAISAGKTILARIPPFYWRSHNLFCRPCNQISYAYTSFHGYYHSGPLVVFFRLAAD